MDSIYLVTGIGIAAIAIAFAWKEISITRKEVDRHKAAALRFRAFVSAQKYELATAIVERLKLRDAEFPPVTMAIYSKVVDLYDSAELIPYSTPVLARDRYDMYWTRADFEDVEIFSLWLEGIIEHGSD